MTHFATARWPGIARAPRTPLKARVAKAILRPTVNHVPVRLTFANGSAWGAGTAESPEMRVVRPKSFFARLGADTKIGFGEAYMAGDWTTGPGTDLADLLEPFAARMATIVPVPLQKFRVFVDKKLPHHQRNSVKGSRKNIEAHYDLSNDLFAQFLDPSMTYSVRLVREPRAGPRGRADAQDRRDPRRRARHRRAPGCSRSAAGGAPSRSAPRNVAPRSRRSRCRPSRPPSPSSGSPRPASTSTSSSSTTARSPASTTRSSASR